MDQQEQGPIATNHRPPTSATNGDGSALLRDSSGRPLFPSLYKFRLDSRELLKKSSQQVATAIKRTDDQYKGLSKQVSSAIRTLQIRGESIPTDYGRGRVIDYNVETGTYEVRLSFGTLYMTTIQKHGTPSSSNNNGKHRRKPRRAATNLELNSAYENWERARLVHVKRECEELGIPYTEETMHRCFACLTTSAGTETTASQQQQRRALLSDADGNPVFPRLYRFRQSSQQMIQNATTTGKASNDTPCLLCAAPVCNKHSSDAFRREGITVCDICLHHLEYDFDAAKLPQELHEQSEHLAELYGRARLLLEFCAQFMLATATALEEKKQQHNQIGVGGSGAGLVSGVLGVAAACTILTPAGPPLLIASLVFGGSATAVQAGSEVNKYYSEPNQFANRILTLQGICERILASVQLMRETTLLPYLDQAILEDSKTANQRAEPCGVIPQNDAKRNAVARAGTRMGSTAATSAASSLAVQEAALTGRFFSRAGTAAARTARFARFAGGALSAATLVLEARELHNALDQIKLGSPCEKAVAVRSVYANRNKMPSRTYVEKVCQSYVKIRSKELFKAALVGGESDATPRERPESDLRLIEEVVSTLESARDDDSVSSSETSKSRTKPSSKVSLLERVRRFKEKEAKKSMNEEKMQIYLTV